MIIICNTYKFLTTAVSERKQHSDRTGSISPFVSFKVYGCFKQKYMYVLLISDLPMIKQYPV